MKKEKKGFTLIELIAVLVILAILALIVTPLVMNIIKKVRISADKRSIDAYGKSIELAVSSYLLENGTFPNNISDLTIEYSGAEVVCSTTQLNSDSSVYLTGCSVGGVEVKDSSTTDGYYHYGREQETGSAGYSVGEQVTYKGINFYVIKDSDDENPNVTLMKQTPLTTEEVDEYGEGHVNVYVGYGQISNQAYDSNGYGGMVYYDSESCRLGTSSGCTSAYSESQVKYVVDGWVVDQLTASDLVADSTGYGARLLMASELENLGYEMGDINPSTQFWMPTENTPTFMTSNNYIFWTMDINNDSGGYMYAINGDGTPQSINSSMRNDVVVRPVITVKKSALTS